MPPKINKIPGLPTKGITTLSILIWPGFNRVIFRKRLLPAHIEALEVRVKALESVATLTDLPGPIR